MGRHTLLILFALLAGLLLRLGWFHAIDVRHPEGFMAPDSRGYIVTAMNMIDHRSFSRSTVPPLVPEFERTPVYPLFLSGLLRLGGGVRGAVLAQAVLSVLNGALVALLAWCLTRKPAVCVVAALFMELDLPSVVFGSQILTETLFTTLFAAVMLAWMMWRRRASVGWLLLCGALAGLAVLCRPVGIVLLPLIPAFEFLALPRPIAARLAAASAFILAALVVIAPWVARNHHLSGSAFISTIGNRNLLYYRAAGALALQRGVDIEDVQRELEQQALAGFAGDPDRDLVGLRRREGEMGRALVMATPLAQVRVMAVACVHMLLSPVRSDIDVQLGLRGEDTALDNWDGNTKPRGFLAALRENTSLFTLALVALQFALLAALWALYLTGALACAVRRDFPALALLVVTLGAFAAVSAGPEAYARMRVPLMPCLAIAAGIGWTVVWQWLERLRPGARQRPGKA